MRKAVRYFSRHGHTKKIAEAIAEGAGVQAIYIEDEPELKEEVEILFLGGSPYANIMDRRLRTYAQNLNPDLVERVILFTTSNRSRLTVIALRKILTDKEIKVDPDYFYAHLNYISECLEDARKLGAKHH